MAQHDGNKQRGWVNYFRVLAGGYLLYLAYQLMKGIWSQDDALPEQKRPATPAEQVGPEADQKGRDEE